jgi:hypothetical protein
MMSGIILFARKSNQASSYMGKKTIRKKGDLQILGFSCVEEVALEPSLVVSVHTRRGLL